MAPHIPCNPASELLAASAVPRVLQTLASADEASTLRHRPESNSPATQTIEEEPYRVRLIWGNIIGFVCLHAGAVYGLWLLVSGACRLYTVLWAFLIGACGAMGITAGTHRLWSHRSYKAKWPLRLILAIFQVVAFQNSILTWCRVHRKHHKFSETNADPHNALRGFFFAHIGWLLCHEHPDVTRKGASVDMSDLEHDPIVMWQHRTYKLVTPLLCFALPVWVPIHFWGEEDWTSFYVAGILRCVISMNITWLINSVAHMWGNRPFDKNIGPTDTLPMVIATFGDGWHNYHHVFPWDYQASELGDYSLNVTTAFIDLFARLGWAWDLKTVSEDMVNQRAARTGDGSYAPRYEKRKKNSRAEEVAAKPMKLQQLHHLSESEAPVWGWGDKDMLQEDATATVRANI